MINNINCELEKLKDTVYQNEVSYFERQNIGDNFEYGKNEYFCIKIWNEKGETILNSFYTIGTKTKQIKEA